MKAFWKSDKKYLMWLHLLMLFYSIGAICSKMASGYPVLSKEFILLYAGVILILMVYALLWQQILKKMSLITAYANKAVTVIWGMVWGYLIFHEKITISNIIGGIVIMIGVYFVVTGEKE